jgi:hypothetical protein
MLNRIDMVWREHGETQLANAEFDSITDNDESRASEIGNVQFEGITVRWLSFRWHTCAVKLTPPPTTWVPIWAWFDDWFDIDDQKPVDIHGLGEVVHSVSRIEERDGSCQFVVDLGSAPVSTVVELLRACRNAGAHTVMLG